MGTISRVTTWSTGDTLTASDLNGEFDNILSTANGSITADNLGVTAGQASASKAIVLDANKDFANVTTSNQIRNLTISGSLKIGTTFLPDAAGGADLGSTSLEWGDVYVADDKYLYMGSDQNIKIGYDETTTDSLAISAIEGAGLAITLRADEGDDAGDEWKLNVADGGVVTFGNDINSAGTFVTHLTLTPHATVASSTLALAGGLTVAGTAGITGVATVGGLTIGSAVINEAELETIDGVTAGTVAASKAVVVDSNLDIASFRNVTLTGELDAATGDFSGDVDVDGTLEADAITLGGTALGSLYSPIAGSSSIVTVGTIGTGTWQGTAIALAYGGTGLVGATDGKIVIADGSGAPVLLDVGSSTAITVLGTVATGTWQGTAVASAYLDADTAHLTTTQTFSGAKTFSAAAQFSNTVTVGVNGTGYDVQLFGDTAGSSVLWDQSADDLILTNAGLAVGSDATGDVYYRDASGFLARLGASTDGHVLTTGGSGTIPAWEAAPGSGSFSGPGSSTENAVVRFTNTSGNAGDNSGILIDDSNNVTGAGNVTLSGELDAATGDFSGIIDVAGAATLASLVCTAGGTFGGGYGSTGATISTAGVGQFNGNLTTDGLLAAATMTLSSTSTISGDMTFGDNVKVTLGTGGDADLSYNGADTVLLTSVAGTGGLGIGTAPDLMVQDGVHIKTGDSGAAANVHADELIVEGSANSGINILSGASNTGRITFTDSGGDPGAVTYVHSSNEMVVNTNSLEAIRIDASANVKLTTGNLVMSTSGKGIDFSATSNGGDGVSELLDDYEEGTFTAVWKFGTTENTKASDSAAWYTKVGKLVTVWFKGAISGAPSGTGNLSISGLPFTSESTSNHIATTGVWANRITNIGDGVTSEMYPNTTLVSIQKIASSTSSDIGYVQHSDCVINTQVRFNISYRAA